jgi:UDP-N-acetylglucosamine:LPS N-acetylglucosamine transferase
MHSIEFKEGEKFALALPYDDPDLYLKAVLESNLKSKHFSLTGFPVRPACQKKYSEGEVRSLKEKHGMDAVRKTITLIMGAVGGDVLYRYVKEFAQVALPSPVQINVCIGRNKEIGKKILELFLSQGGKIVRESEGCTSLLSAKGLLLHIRAYTKEVTEIMAASDLIITKTGSCSVNEAIYLGKKLLLDNTKYSSARHIWWEGFNVSFVQKHNLGDALFDFKELESKVAALLESDTPHPTASGMFRTPNFQENVANLVQNMIASHLAETKAPRSEISS